MGTYIYTCRSEKKLIDGATIGRFTFAYKYGRDGWEPGSYYSNKHVKSLETRAQKARDSFAGEHSLFVAVPSLATKTLVGFLKCESIRVYSVPRRAFQFIEEFDGVGTHVGHLSLINGQVKYIPLAA